MTSRGLDRRELLKLLATLSVGASSAGLLIAQETGAAVLEGLGEVEVEAIRDLAKAYESGSDDRSGVGAMVERLEGTDFTDNQLVLELRQEMRSDFAAGRTASLYGWVVSRTEARALAAISRLLE